MLWAAETVSAKALRWKALQEQGRSSRSVWDPATPSAALVRPFPEVY